MWELFEFNMICSRLLSIQRDGRCFWDIAPQPTKERLLFESLKGQWNVWAEAQSLKVFEPLQAGGLTVVVGGDKQLHPSPPHPPNLPFRHCLSCGTRSVMTLSLRACNAVLRRLRMKSGCGIEWQFNQRPFQHMPRICFSSNCCTSPGLQGDDRSCWGSGRVGTLCFQRALNERATEPWSAGGEWKRAFECFPPSVVQCIDYEERFPKTMTVGHLWRTSCRALPYFLCGSASVQNIKGRVDF